MWDFSEILFGINWISNSDQSAMLEQLRIEGAKATAPTLVVLQFILLK